MPLGNIRSNVNDPAERTLNPFDSEWGLLGDWRGTCPPPWKSQQELNTSTQVLRDKARNRPRLAPACPEVLEGRPTRSVEDYAIPIPSMPPTRAPWFRLMSEATFWSAIACSELSPRTKAY
jgi:hypothetical protein